MTLMVFFSSQDLSLGIDGDLLGQVALATAVVTWAMLRTWPSGCRPCH